MDFIQKSVEPIWVPNSCATRAQWVKEVTMCGVGERVSEYE